MRKSMDLFGEALYAYWKGDRTDFMFCEPGERSYFDRSIYFRKSDQLSKLEKRLISKAKGEILDIGCATGYYIPALMKKGKVEGIDISRKAIQVAREKGLANCHVADIFSFSPKKRYDTITLLQNNLGMAENVPKLTRMLKRLSSLLRPGGQILVMQRQIGKPYVINTLWFEWGRKKSSRFKWMNMDTQFLAKLCAKTGLRLNLLGKDKCYDLVRIRKAK